MHRIFGKNHQFTIKGSPSLLEGLYVETCHDFIRANPQYTALASGQHEVVLVLQVTGEGFAEINFQIYLEQAGLFTLNNVATEDHNTILYGVCPNLLFPYVGVAINHWLCDAGFPPVYLAPIDFIALYKQHRQEEVSKIAEAHTIN